MIAELVAHAEHLPIDVRRQAIAVQEELDLLRHCLRLATLQRAIGGPPTSTVVPIQPKPRKRK